MYLKPETDKSVLRESSLKNKTGDQGQFTKSLFLLTSQNLNFKQSHCNEATNFAKFKRLALGRVQVTKGKRQHSRIFLCQ